MLNMINDDDADHENGNYGKSKYIRLLTWTSPRGEEGFVYRARVSTVWVWALH